MVKINFSIFRKLFFSLLMLIAAHAVSAFTPGPKREFRGVWIATIGNIDWPSKPGLSPEIQKQEFINTLDFLQQNGFNAVVVQIRPSADAFYESRYEPWSYYLTGKAGRAPDPYYDPLSFMIAETHRRNMEFHAWINPFRALAKSALAPQMPDNHIVKTHPEWIVSYGGKSYINPGIPEARQYVINVISDIVSRYDIDAIHIDDYFYPYKEAGRDFPDAAAYTLYGNNLPLADWRRNNINQFIRSMHITVRSIKNWVKIGVSPFGIWRNAKDDPRGSQTNGNSSYDGLYADVKLWIDNKWIDYCTPQLYWEHGNKAAAYDVLVPWWKNNIGSRQLYIGLGLYRMANGGKGAWAGTREILKQIETERAGECNGVCFYSMSNFHKITSAVADSLRNGYFGTIAIPPRMPWMDSIAPTAPLVKLNYVNGNMPHLTWQPDIPANTVCEPLKYLVYRFSGNEPVDLNQSANIIALTQDNDFVDAYASGLTNVRYVVTALDRLWNESRGSITVKAGR